MKAVCDKRGEQHPVDLEEGKTYDVEETGSAGASDYYVVTMWNGKTRLYPQVYFRLIAERIEEEEPC